MCLNKIIWWLIIVYSFNKISAFEKLLYKSTLTSYIQMGQFLKLCYPDRVNPVMITTNLIDIIDAIYKDDTNFPVVTLDRNFKAEEIKIFTPAYPLYIVSTNSTNQLQRLLTEIKATPTWNIASIFYFIETADLCQNASQVLQMLWKFDLLSSFYFCIDSNNDIMLYTYNPYTNRAPDLWTEVDTDDKPDDRWTLYKQPYALNAEVCQSFMYDKRKRLDGYKIKNTGDPRLATNITLYKTYHESVLAEIVIYSERMVVYVLFSALNATPEIQFGELGFYENKTAKGYLLLLINGTRDMSVMFRLSSEDAFEVIDMLDLHYQNGFLILTQYKPFSVPTQEAADFVDVNVAFLLFVIVIVVTFIALVINSDNDFAQATLDVLRLIIGGGFHTPLERLSMQICFVNAFLIMFFINPAIQGQISSFLSAPDQRNVDSLQDVYNQKYHFYYHFLLELQMFKSGLWSKPSDKKYLHSDESAYLGCADYPIKDSNAACMSYSIFQVRDSLKYKLYVSKNLELKNYLTYFVRKNWPLKRTVEKVFMRITEAGLIDHWDKEAFYWPRKKIKMYETMRTSTHYTQFKFENMNFAYIFYFVTSIVAFVAFGFEVLLKKIHPPKTKRLRQCVVVFNRRVHVINEWI